MADLDLEAIRARAEAATEGPWEVSHDDLTDQVDVVHDQEQRLWVACTGEVGAAFAEPDAEFIAHARTDVPALLAEVERLTKDRDYWSGEYDDASAMVERVRALMDEWDAGKVVNRAAMDQGIWCPYDPPGPGDIRAALDGQQPASAATSAPDGPEGVETENGAQTGVDDFAPCGDRITTWHGRFGPCIRTDQHEQHEDGHGVVWTWTETEKP